MHSLPNELLVDIVRRVGHSGFKDLAPFVVAGKEGRDAVFSPDVMREVNLDEFMFSSQMALENSPYRPFLLKCLEHGNLMAKYIEGVRLMVGDGSFSDAFDLIYAAMEVPAANFAAGIFLICGGDYDYGLFILSGLWSKVANFGEAVNLADIVVGQIAGLGLPRGRRFEDTHEYEDVPWCVFTTCSATDVCKDCFAFWYARIVCALC